MLIVQKDSLENPSEALREALGMNEQAATKIGKRTGGDWYASQVYVYRCVSIIAQALIEAPWALYRDAAKKKPITSSLALDALNKPNLYQDRATFVQIVRGGALQAQGMPKFGELTDAELDDIRYYVRAQAAQLRGEATSQNKATPSLELK